MTLFWFEFIDKTDLAGNWVVFLWAGSLRYIGDCSIHLFLETFIWDQPQVRSLLERMTKQNQDCWTFRKARPASAGQHCRPTGPNRLTSKACTFGPSRIYKASSALPLQNWMWGWLSWDVFPLPLSFTVDPVTQLLYWDWMLWKYWLRSGLCT